MNSTVSLMAIYLPFCSCVLELFWHRVLQSFAWLWMRTEHFLQQNKDNWRLMFETKRAKTKEFLLFPLDQKLLKPFKPLFLKCLRLSISWVLRLRSGSMDRTAALFKPANGNVVERAAKEALCGFWAQKNKAMLQLCVKDEEQSHRDWWGVSRSDLFWPYPLQGQSDPQLSPSTLPEIPTEQSTGGQNWNHKLLEIICSLWQTGRWRQGILNPVK